MIYLLEPDPTAQAFICYALAERKLKAAAFCDSSELQRAIAAQLPDLLILADENHLSAIQKLRTASATKTLPILVLSAQGSEFDKVLALDNGADDFMTKPYSMLELISRIRALLRRSQFTKLPAQYRVGALQVDVQKHTVIVNNTPVTLTLKEFELLTALLENQGTVLTRDQLQSSIWGYEFEGSNRTIDVHIRTLRQKLSEAADLIQTIRGVGYKLVDG